MTVIVDEWAFRIAAEARRRRAVQMEVRYLKARRELGVTAGRIARTARAIAAVQEQVAARRERLADNWAERAGELRTAAAHARRIAARERREFERWQRVCRAEARTGPSVRS